MHLEVENVELPAFEKNISYRPNKAWKSPGYLEKHPPGVRIDMSSRAGTRTTERGLLIRNGSLRATNVDMPLVFFFIIANSVQTLQSRVITDATGPPSVLSRRWHHRKTPPYILQGSKLHWGCKKNRNWHFKFKCPATATTELAPSQGAGTESIKKKKPNTK